MVWNPPLISKYSVIVIEDDWTGTPHKMPAGLSVHEIYTPQLQRPESSFFGTDRHVGGAGCQLDEVRYISSLQELKKAKEINLHIM